MQEEMDYLHFNGTWDLARPCREEGFVYNKWVYQVEQESDGSKRYKVRVVVKGF